MLVGDQMSYLEQSSGQLFSGEAGKWILRELMKHGVNLEEVYVTKAIKYHIGLRKPAKEEKQKAYEDLVYEISALKPRAILALGATTLEVMAKTTAISKHRGKRLEFAGCPVVFTYNPAVAITDKSKAAEVQVDLSYFSRIVSGAKNKSKLTLKIPTRLSSLCTSIDTIIKLNVPYSYDIENEPDGTIVMIGICVDDRTLVVPVDDKYCKQHTAFTQAEVVFELNRLFKENPKGIAHYGTHDNDLLENYGVKPACTFDTYLAAYLLGEGRLGLKELSKKYCYADDYNENIEFKANLTKEEYEKMAVYCAHDVYYTRKLYTLFMESFQKDPQLYNVFRRIIMPAEKVLQKMHKRGFYMDRAAVEELKKKYAGHRDALKIVLEKALPAGFKGMNLNSTKQLADLLFNELRLPVIERTDGGVPSTGRKTLIYLSEKHDIPKLILEYRKKEKALAGFLDPWLNRYLVGTSRVHTRYNIARTATGRLSAEDPNLQQVPRDPEIRRLVSVPKGFKLIDADYSQIELRTAAWVSGDENMKNAYKRGEDLHLKTACSINRCKPEEVTKEMRSRAKPVNFGYLYGMWWKAFIDYALISYGVVVTESEAQQSRTAYFESYPKLVQYHQRQREIVRKMKGVPTATGRFRPLPNIDSPDTDKRGEAERQAINTPVQSLASDMMLVAMVLIDKNLEKYGEDAFLVGQIHDAIHVEAKDEIAYEVGCMVKKVMESVPVVLKKYFGIDFDVPLVADVEIGTEWGQGKGLEEFKKSC